MIALTWHLLFVVLFVLCEVAAAFGWPAFTRPALGWLGLAFLGLALIF